MPKATEKNAVCGTNQSFNSITRSCVNIAQPISKPVATLSSDILTQEVSKTITLTYTDAKNYAAISCRLTAISSNIEAISPQVINGGVFAQADAVFFAAQSAANSLPAGVDQTAAIAQKNNMQAALAIAKVTFNYSNLINQLGLFKTAANNLLTIVAPYSLSSSTVKYYYDSTQAKMIDFNSANTFVVNRCDCSGGVCTTIIAPKLSQTGASGFSYTISDLEGEGDLKNVNLTIAALPGSTNFLAPAVESSFLTYPQSATNTPTTYSIVLPVARDYLNTTSFNYLVTSQPTKGSVSNCRTVASSHLCDYTPTSGDLYDTITPTVATATIGDLVFTAKKAGSYANNYTIQYFDLQANNVAVDSTVTKNETFGLVSLNNNESFVRVVGNSVKVFINPGVTTSSDILNLLNADQKAKSLFVVTGGSLATFPIPSVSTPSAVALAGGSDAFDKFSIAASNASGTSSNTATVMVKISHTDHAPLTPTQYNLAYMPLTMAYTTTTAEAEGTTAGQVVTLNYFDADNSPTVKPVSCAVDFATPPNIGLSYLVPTTCSCDVNGVCSASVVPITYFNGTARFSYTITTTDQLSAATITSASESVVMSVWEVNNPPVLTAATATATAAGIPTSYTAPLGTLQMQENSTAAPSSAYVCVSANAGGGADEATQTLTVTPTQTTPTSNPNLVMTFGAVLAPGVGGNSCGVGLYMVPFTTTQNQSGTTNLKITLADNGTTHGIADPKSVNQIIPIQVNFVDDPPFFVQSIASVQSNEGGSVVAGPFIVDEDQGSSPDEDAQGVKIANITSDNPGVLPVSAITVFYDLNDNGVEDAGESRTFGASSTVVPAAGVPTLEAVASDNVKLHKFYLKLNPVPGVSGNSNITVTVNDGSALATHFTSKTFSLIVNPVAALHGGWANISAVGIKTDKNGAPASSNDIVCNYNKATDASKCDTTTTDCTGTTPPNSVVTPSAVNVLYWDSGSKRCYRSQGTDKFSWVEIKTTCPITRLAGGQNFLYDSTLLPTQTIPTATAIGQYYFNTASNSCKYSTLTGSTFGWSATSYIPSKVTLSWNQFMITGSGPDSNVQIAGWNVYRREAGQDYDFINGFLKLNSADTKTLSDPMIRTFTDTTAIAGKVYYYLVRPIDSNHSFATYTPDVISEVRVLAPVENYAFVHRWIVNQEVCNSMHMTTTTTNKVDPTHNYRCPYSGPGESTVTPGFYDIEKDMLVDISESGCPYSSAPKCSSSGCIGIGAPATLTLSGMLANDVYYDRSAGGCYIYDGAAWVGYNAASAVQIAAASVKSNTALNAPLVNISEAQANLVCTNRSSASATANLTGVISTPQLPTKKEYVAYSSAPVGMSDAVITDIEQGPSLNLQSRCNSLSANGLETSYTDSTIPSSSFLYSLPGTASSGIRSLYTGSIPWGSDMGTEACSSRYGIQDVYGNVAEWVKDKMTCNGAPSAFVCKTNAGTSLGDYNFGGGAKYGFDFVTGPYSDANGDSIAGAGDAFLTNWIFRDRLFTAGKFSFPVGMPININIGTSLPTSPSLPYLLDIGPTAGITNNQLHEDGITINGAAVNNAATNPTQTGSFAQGGSYLSGNLSGRYSSELVPDSVVRSDIGFRCYIPVDKTNFPADTARHNYPY